MILNCLKNKLANQSFLKFTLSKTFKPAFFYTDHWRALCIDILFVYKINVDYVKLLGNCTRATRQITSFSLFQQAHGLLTTL